MLNSNTLARTWFLGLVTMAIGCSGRPDASPPSIVVLSIDTLRPDRLGCYGHDRDTSPFLDELAAKGTLFEQAWAPSPWTLPSHGTMLTGLYPHHHGATRSNLSLDAGAVRVAELLSRAGYATAGVVTSIFVSDKYGLGLGFDFFDDFGHAAGTRETKEAPDAEEVFGKALRWEEQLDNETPAFAFLHVYDVHYPYDAPGDWDEKYDRKSTPAELEYQNYFFYLRNPVPATAMEHQRTQYDEEIAYVDDAFRRFHEQWTSRRPNTIFVVVSDHGEEFGERGSWGHAHTLLPEVLRIPFIVNGPGVATQTVDQRTGLEDLAPTLAGLAGLPFPPCDGLDRSEQLRTGRRIDEAHVSARFASSSRFRTLKHRWHAPPLDYIHDLGRGVEQLFDLEADPFATRGLLRQRPDDVVRLRGELYAWLGEPWKLQVDARVETTGVLVATGQRLGPITELEAGDSFAVFPLDAQVTVVVHEENRGPYAAAGGERPAPDDPVLRFEGFTPAADLTNLSDEELERLRALGYIH